MTTPIGPVIAVNAAVNGPTPALAAANALAALAREPVTDEVRALYPNENLEFGTGYIIPKPFDRRLFECVSFAVAEAAVKSGVAGIDVDLAAYREELRKRNLARV